jgi:hypothetical protein
MTIQPFDNASMVVNVQHLTFKSSFNKGRPRVPFFCNTFPMLLPAAASNATSTASQIILKFNEG